jgi:hypothetical protein
MMLSDSIKFKFIYILLHIGLQHYLKYSKYGDIQKTVLDFVNTLPRNNYVNKVQHAIVYEAVFSADLPEVPVDWLIAIM